MKRLCCIAILFLLAVSLGAQNKSGQDSLVRLLQAETAKQYDRYGMSYREVTGSQVTFLHNDTYLLCDSASWNVDAGLIEAYGNVQLIQDQTKLTSENLVYLIDQNLAKFRGGIVELTDKDGNLLRTEQLDYNTKDSVALFYYGGAMKDTEGNVMESSRGTYDAKINTFTFERNVEMFADTARLKTDVMRYLTNEEKAYFYENTFAWRGNGFVKANGGWYDTKNHILSFNNDVFMDDPDYEAWANEVFYYQDTSFVEMRDQVQVLDTANKVILLADKAIYDRETEAATLTDNPAVVFFGENEEHIVDTLFMRADTMLFYSVRLSSIEENEINDAAKRKEDMLYDSLSAQRQEQAKKRQEDWVAKMKEYGKLPQDYDPDDPDGSKKRAADSLANALPAADSLANEIPPADSLSNELPAADSIPNVLPAADSLAMNPNGSDSLSVEAPVADSTANPADTVKIRYIRAYNDVRMYRSDIQARCDSLVFCELDSIARLFNRPILWNEGKNQLTADAMQLLMQDGNVTRGAMLDNAMITTKEDSIHFNQIKSTEMTGYFRNNELYRFDALGGVNAVFYLVEDESLTTLNIKESRSLTAVIRNGNAEKLLYTETIKSDAYPITSLEIEKQRLNGFEWRGEERPVSRNEVTDRKLKESERDRYVDVTMPTYRYINRFFDNMMEDYSKKEADKSQDLIRRMERDIEKKRTDRTDLQETEIRQDIMNIQ